MKIINSHDHWTAVDATTSYRTWGGWVYRKVIDPTVAGGVRIHKVGLGTLLSKEWIGQ